MSDVWWSTQNQVPPQPVIEANTVGDQQQNVYQNIPGGTAGSIPTGYSQSAQAVYPLYGSVAFPSTPLSQLNLADFPTWHSAHQREYILAQLGSPPFHRIPAVGDAQAVYVLIDNNTKPVNILSYTMTDYAMLSAADKSNLRLLLQNIGVADRLGLTTDKSTVNAAVNALVARINSSTIMPEADRRVFTDQLAILGRQVTGTDMIVPDTILSEVKAISDRFDRALTFRNTRDPATMTGLQFYRNEGNPVGDQYYGVLGGVSAQGLAVSSDNNATVKAGYEEFMRAERAILASAKRREGLSAPNAIRDARMDVANLIFQLQLLYEAEAQGIADAGTEEIRQLHKLLQDYGVMQRLVQETIKAYDPSKPEERRRFMDIGGRQNGTVDTNQVASERGDHDVLITYSFSNGAYIDGPGGSRPGSAQTQIPTHKDSPAYHWFHLQGGGIVDAQLQPANYGTGNPNYADEVGWSTYARYSRIYDDGDINRIRNLGEFPQKQNGGLSTEEMRIFSMFNDDSWAKILRQGHPMEVLYGVERPTLRFTAENEAGFGSLELYRKTVWDSFSTQLNDTVTLLNQRNQLKQNEIESATRRQNRHFELGNNALRKMNDLLMTIGRM